MEGTRREREGSVTLCVLYVRNCLIYEEDRVEEPHNTNGHIIRTTAVISPPTIWSKSVPICTWDSSSLKPGCHGAAAALSASFSPSTRCCYAACRGIPRQGHR